MKKIILLFVLLFSCADNILDKQDNIIDFRNKMYENSKHVGAYCSENCIWSKYAVDLNIHQTSENCVDGRCVCVENGNVYSLCDVDSTSNVDNVIQTTEDNHAEDKSIPYYNQYDNINYGWATCQNTSIAMVLSYYEIRIHPDTIFGKWGKDIAQSPSGLNLVYSDYSSNSTIRTYTNATPEKLIDFLNRGFTVIVHGYFTQYGHVLVVKSFDGNFYYVNDPAGQWKGCFKCGYSTSYDGVTRYSKEAFENAVFTSDGYSYLPGWIHIIK
jgi:uncharacterized protein YvpB